MGERAQDHYKPRNPCTFNDGQIQHFLTLHGLYFVAFFRRERERERGGSIGVSQESSQRLGLIG